MSLPVPPWPTTSEHTSNPVKQSFQSPKEAAASSFEKTPSPKSKKPAEAGPDLLLDLDSVGVATDKDIWIAARITTRINPSLMQSRTPLDIVLILDTSAYTSWPAWKQTLKIVEDICYSLSHPFDRIAVVCTATFEQHLGYEGEVTPAARSLANMTLGHPPAHPDALSNSFGPVQNFGYTNTRSLLAHLNALEPYRDLSDPTQINLAYGIMLAHYLAYVPPGRVPVEPNHHNVKRMILISANPAACVDPHHDHQPLHVIGPSVASLIPAIPSTIGWKLRSSELERPPTDADSSPQTKEIHDMITHTRGSTSTPYVHSLNITPITPDHSTLITTLGRTYHPVLHAGETHTLLFKLTNEHWHYLDTVDEEPESPRPRIDTAAFMALAVKLQYRNPPSPTSGAGPSETTTYHQIYLHRRSRNEPWTVSAPKRSHHGVPISPIIGSSTSPSGRRTPTPALNPHPNPDLSLDPCLALARGALAAVGQSYDALTALAWLSVLFKDREEQSREVRGVLRRVKEELRWRVRVGLGVLGADLSSGRNGDGDVDVEGKVGRLPVKEAVPGRWVPAEVLVQWEARGWRGRWVTDYVWQGGDRL